MSVTVGADLAEAKLEGAKIELAAAEAKLAAAEGKLAAARLSDDQETISMAQKAVKRADSAVDTLSRHVDALRAVVTASIIGSVGPRSSDGDSKVMRGSIHDIVGGIASLAIAPSSSVVSATDGLVRPDAAAFVDNGQEGWRLFQSGVDVLLASSHRYGTIQPPTPIKGAEDLRLVESKVVVSPIAVGFPDHLRFVDRREELFEAAKVLIANNAHGPEPTLTELVASNARYGSGKSQLAMHLVNLPVADKKKIEGWAATQSPAHQIACQFFLNAHYLLLHFERLPKYRHHGVTCLDDALALLVFRSVAGDSLTFRPGYHTLEELMKLLNESARNRGLGLLLHWEEEGLIETADDRFFSSNATDDDDMCSPPPSSSASPTALPLPRAHRSLLRRGALRRHYALWSAVNPYNNQRHACLFNFFTGKSLAFCLLHQKLLSDTEASPSGYRNITLGALAIEDIIDTLQGTLLVDQKTSVAAALGLVPKQRRARVPEMDGEMNVDDFMLRRFAALVLRVTAGVPRLVYCCIQQSYELTRVAPKLFGSPPVHWIEHFRPKGSIFEAAQTAAGAALPPNIQHADWLARIYWGALFGTEFSSTDTVPIDGRPVPLLVLVQHWEVYVARVSVPPQQQKKHFRYRLVLPEAARSQLLSIGSFGLLGPLFHQPVVALDQGGILEHYTRVCLIRHLLQCQPSGAAVDLTIGAALPFLQHTVAGPLLGRLVTPCVTLLPAMLSVLQESKRSKDSKSSDDTDIDDDHPWTHKRYQSDWPLVWDRVRAQTLHVPAPQSHSADAMLVASTPNGAESGVIGFAMKLVKNLIAADLLDEIAKFHLTFTSLGLAAAARYTRRLLVIVAPKLGGLEAIAGRVLNGPSSYSLVGGTLRELSSDEVAKRSRGIVSIPDGLQVLVLSYEQQQQLFSPLALAALVSFAENARRPEPEHLYYL